MCRGDKDWDVYLAVKCRKSEYWYLLLRLIYVFPTLVSFTEIPVKNVKYGKVSLKASIGETKNVWKRERERERGMKGRWGEVREGGWEGGCVVSGNCHSGFLVTILQCRVPCHTLTHYSSHYPPPSPPGNLLKINATKQLMKYIKLIWSDLLLSFVPNKKLLISSLFKSCHLQLSFFLLKMKNKCSGTIYFWSGNAGGFGPHKIEQPA